MVGIFSLNKSRRCEHSCSRATKNPHKAAHQTITRPDAVSREYRRKIGFRKRFFASESGE
jgi:hypothetical protein